MRYDLIIIGGGLVGSGLATALKDLPLRIALIDARSHDSIESRLFALSESSCRFLTNLALWEKLKPYATPIHSVQVSHEGHFGTVRFSSNDLGLASLGHVIPAHNIEKALDETILTSPTINLYRPAKLLTLTQKNNLATATLSTPQGEKNLQAPLIIGADGTYSTVRDEVKIEKEAIDYAQSAIVTRTKLHRSHHNIAYERFTKEGAIAMLPLAHNECATIWTAHNVLVNQLVALESDAFLASLQKKFGYRLGRLEAVSERFIYPLRMV